MTRLVAIASSRIRADWTQEQEYQRGYLFDLDLDRYVDDELEPCGFEDAAIVFDDALSEEPDEWYEMAEASAREYGFVFTGIAVEDGDRTLIPCARSL